MVTTPGRRAPIHWVAWAAIAMAAVAGVLSLYGSMHSEKHIPDSPLRQARGSAGLPAQPTTRAERAWVKAETSVFGDRVDRKVLAAAEHSKGASYAVQFVAYFLPFVLGLGAALAGGWAMKFVQASGGNYVGNTLAVFSMMIGGLAAVVAGCMMMSIYVWPNLPSVYA